MKPHEHIILEIARERERQMGAEGWTLEHDDTHKRGQMAKAAACYALNSALPDTVREVADPSQLVFLRRFWPWDANWWKPTNPRRELIKAAALMIAEIERLDRAAARKAAA